MVEIGQSHIGLRVLAVSKDAAVLEFADHGLHDRMIGAHHCETVERHILDEGTECILHGVKSLEVVEMLGVDVCNDRDVGWKLQKGAIGFVGLHHHPVASPEAGDWMVVEADDPMAPF